MRPGYILPVWFLMTACAAPPPVLLPRPVPPPAVVEPVPSAMPAQDRAPALRPSPPPPRPAPGPEGEGQILDIPPLDESEIPEPGGEGTNVEEVAAPSGDAGGEDPDSGEAGARDDADAAADDAGAALPVPDPDSEPAGDAVVSEGAEL